MKKQTFLKGVLILSVAGIGVKLMGFVYRVILTNLQGYGDEGNGIYGAGFQVYLVLYALSTTGFPSAISRMVAGRVAVGDRYGAHRIFKVALWLLTGTGFTVSLLFFLSAPYLAAWISNAQTAYTLAALSPTIFFVSIMAVYRGYFQGLQDMTPQAVSQIIEQGAKMIAAVCLAYVLLPYGVAYSAAGATLGTALGAAAGAFFLRTLYNMRKQELWGEIRRTQTRKTNPSAFQIIKTLAATSIPISMGAVILTAANIIDLSTVMKQLERAGFSHEHANRMYGILTGKCYVLAHFPVSVTMALAASLVPAIAGAMAVKDYRAVSQKITGSLRLCLLIGLPASAGMILLAGPILKLLFPGSSEGAELLALSACGVVLIGLTQILSGILHGLGKVAIPAISLLAGATVKVIMNFTLMPMPHINIRGAIYGTLACYAVSAAISLIALKKNFRLKLEVYPLIIKPIVAVLFMSAAIIYIYGALMQAAAGNTLATCAAIGAAVVVYGASLLLLGAVDAKDIRALPFGKNRGMA